MSDASLLLRLYVMHVPGEIAETIKIKSPGRMMQSTFVLGFFPPNNRWKIKPPARPTSLHLRRTHADDDGHQRKIKKRQVSSDTRVTKTREYHHIGAATAIERTRKWRAPLTWNEIRHAWPSVSHTHDAYLFLFRLYSSSLEKGDFLLSSLRVGRQILHHRLSLSRALLF